MIKSSQDRSEVPQFDLLGVDDLPVYVVDPGRRQICTTKTNSLHLHQGLCEDVDKSISEMLLTFLSITCCVLEDGVLQ